MKKRADVLLVEKGLARSREKAKAMIIAGIVRNGERIVSSPSDLFEEAAPLSVVGSDCPYVSRAGLSFKKHWMNLRLACMEKYAWMSDVLPVGLPTACFSMGPRPSMRWMWATDSSTGRFATTRG